MAQKIKQEEEFEKERDELLMRIEMSRAKEPWLKQCWKKGNRQMRGDQKRSSKDFFDEGLTAMIG